MSEGVLAKSSHRKQTFSQLVQLYDPPPLFDARFYLIQTSWDAKQMDEAVIQWRYSLPHRCHLTLPPVPICGAILRAPSVQQSCCKSPLYWQWTDTGRPAGLRLGMLRKILQNYSLKHSTAGDMRTKTPTRWWTFLLCILAETICLK